MATNHAMLAAADEYLQHATESRNDAVPLLTAGRTEAGPVLLGALVDALIATAMLARMDVERREANDERIRSGMDILAGAAERIGVAPPPSDVDPNMREVPATVMDELIGAASDAICALGPDHEASIRLMTATQYAGAGVTLGTKGT